MRKCWSVGGTGVRTRDTMGMCRSMCWDHVRTVRVRVCWSMCSSICTCRNGVRVHGSVLVWVRLLLRRSGMRIGCRRLHLHQRMGRNEMGGNSI